MSSNPPRDAVLARTLEPQEREQVEVLRGQLSRQLTLVVGLFLAAALIVVLDTGRRESVPLPAKLMGSAVVVAFAALVWAVRRRIGRLAGDLEQGAVYRLEGTLESKHRWRQKRRMVYRLKVAGERFDVEEKQFEAIAPGAPCTIEFLPATRLALSVNGIRRWP